jgi:hypothetical protein
VTATRLPSHRISQLIRTILLACVILTPLAFAGTAMHLPTVTPVFASTVAVAVHRPAAFRSSWLLVGGSYLLGLVLAVTTIVFVGESTLVPRLVLATIGAAVLAGSPAGRQHPPSASIPLALASLRLPDPPLDVLVFVLAALYLLLALRLVTRRISSPRAVGCDCPLLGRHLDDVPCREVG